MGNQNHISDLKELRIKNNSGEPVWFTIVTNKDRSIATINVLPRETVPSGGKLSSPPYPYRLSNKDRLDLNLKIKEE